MKVKHDLVLVEWDDACNDSAWMPVNSVLKPFPCITVGFLIHDEPSFIQVASTLGLGDTSEVSSRFTIPRGCIRKIKVLRKGYT